MPSATATEPQGLPVAETAEQVKLAKAPSAYHVLQLVDGAWKHLTEKNAVKATSRKEAIKKATASLEEKAGKFVAIREAEFAPMTRKVKQEVVDLFE